MPGNLPSGKGQTTKQQSLSVVLASDHDALPGAGTDITTLAKEVTLAAANVLLTAANALLTGITGKLTAQLGPNRGVNLFAFAMTTTSAISDFSTSTQLLADIAAGKEFVLTAEGGDIWYSFSPNTSSATVSATAVGSTLGATICDYIPAGQSTPPMIIPPGSVSVSALASNPAAILRMRRVN